MATAQTEWTAATGLGRKEMRMTKISTKALAVAVTALALSTPVPGWALTAPSSAMAVGVANMVVAQAAAGADAAAAPADAGGLSDATKQGVGCIVGATASLGYATYVAGATEALMIAAGGLLAPSASPTLWLGLTATLAAATCSMGAAATPVVLWAVEQKDNIGANLSYQAKAVGNEVIQASGQLATSIAQLSGSAVAGLMAAVPGGDGSQQMASRPDAAR